MNSLLNIPGKYKIFLVLILGFILRFNNLTIGFPILLVSNDEAIYHQSALNMIADKTLFTIGNYGPLGSYIQIPFLILASAVLFITGKITNINDLEFLLLTQEGYMLFIPRVISVMFGTLSILVIYKLAYELFRDQKIAIWAGLLGAISFNLVHISHLARGWAGAIFFILLAVLFALKSTTPHKNQLKNTLLAYFFSAVGFGFHQMTGLAFLLIILIRILARNKESSFIDDFKGIFLWIILLLILNFLSLGSNFLRLLTPNHPTVGLILIPQDKNFMEFITHFFSPSKFFHIFHNLLISDGIIVILATLFFLRHSTQKIIFPLLIYIIFNMFLAAAIFPPFLRYLLPSLFLLPIFAASSLVSITERLHNSYLFLSLFLVFILIGSSFNSLSWNLLILKTPTFIQVRQWLDQNIDQQVPIAYTASRYFGYTPSWDAGTVIRKFKPNYYLRSSQLINKNYPPNVRNILYTNQLDGNNKKEKFEKGIKMYPVNFVIDSYLISSDRLLPHLDQEKFKLVAHFSPSTRKIYNINIPEPLTDPAFSFPLFKIDRVGPYFDVLEIKK